MELNSYEEAGVNGTNGVNIGDDGFFNKVVPLKKEMKDLSDFPVECLPPKIRKYARQVAENTQTTVDMAATFALGVLAACGQRKVQVEGKKDYTEQTSLYVLVLAESGERKSAVLKKMVFPILEYERETNEQLDGKIKNNKQKRDILEGKLKDLTRNMKKNQSKEDFVELEKRLHNTENELKKIPDIKKVQYLADDSTNEALIKLLAENNGRMTVVSAEGGIFGNMQGRYNTQKANYDVWLKAYSGDMIRVNRIGREHDTIYQPALSAIIAAQPVVLEEVLKNAAMTERGLLARFLVARPKSKVGARIFDTRDIDSKVQEEYSNLIQSLLRVTPEKVKTLTLSEEARMLIGDFYTENEKYMKTDGTDMRDWANKLVGQILRISGLLHMAEYGVENMEISKNTVNKAINIGQYFLSQAQYNFAALSEESELNKACFILNKLKENQTDEIKRSKLVRLCRSRFIKKKENILSALDLLEEHGYIRQEVPEYAGQGRPADVNIYVNLEALKEL